MGLLDLIQQPGVGVGGMFPQMGRPAPMQIGQAPQIAPVPIYPGKQQQQSGGLPGAGGGGGGDMSGIIKTIMSLFGGGA